MRAFIYLFYGNAYKDVTVFRNLSIYYRRFWPFIWLVIISFVYILSINVSCIFPENLCASNDEITKRFSSIISVLGALIIVVNLDETFRKYRDKSLATHLLDEAKRPTKNLINASITMPSIRVSVKGGSLYMVHKKNAETLHELRDHIYEELSRMRSESREELTNLEKELSSSIEAANKEIDSLVKKLSSLRSELEGIAVGNTNRQLFGIILIFLGATLNVL